MNKRRPGKSGLEVWGLFEENLGGVDVQLTAAELREIDDASAAITIHGARYSEGSQRMVDR